MENNEKDFMKNRPVASGANQAKDVYSTMKKSSISILTVLLSVVMIACAVACFLRGRILSGILFLVLFVILIMSTVVAKRSEKANSKPESVEHPDAIFKDHED
ncbi:MAG: hypothetical protein E7513_07575 [Ruminococcaceae bacterium]|nr:hypothetical protein [Oscillospiraceae bacterium]